MFQNSWVYLSKSNVLNFRTIETSGYIRLSYLMSCLKNIKSYASLLFYHYRLGDASVTIDHDNKQISPVNVRYMLEVMSLLAESIDVECIKSRWHLGVLTEDILTFTSHCIWMSAKSFERVQWDILEILMEGLCPLRQAW